MGTTTVIAQGYDWSAAALHDGWGADTSDEQVADLAEQVRTEFEELCAAEGNATVDWQPKLSEVHAECYGQDTDEHSKWDLTHADVPLDELRAQAIETVWTQFIES